MPADLAKWVKGKSSVVGVAVVSLPARVLEASFAFAAELRSDSLYVYDTGAGAMITNRLEDLVPESIVDANGEEIEDAAGNFTPVKKKGRMRVRDPITGFVIDTGDASKTGVEAWYVPNLSLIHI